MEPGHIHHQNCGKIEFMGGPTPGERRAAYILHRLSAEYDRTRCSAKVHRTDYVSENSSGDTSSSSSSSSLEGNNIAVRVNKTRKRGQQEEIQQQANPYSPGGVEPFGTARKAMCTSALDTTIIRRIVRLPGSLPTLGAYFEEDMQLVSAER